MTDRTPKDAPRHIETEIEIDAPPDAVWAALTDAGQLTNWFPLEATVEPGEGGFVRLGWDEPGCTWETPITVWKENEHLQLVHADPAPPSERGTEGEEGADAAPPVPFRIAIDYYLEARGGGTVLRLVHSGFSRDASWDNQYDGTVRGWAFELRGLKHYLEQHGGRKRVVVHAKAGLGDLTLDEAWARLMSERGLVADGALPAAPGDPYAITTAAGDRFEGTASIVGPPRDLCATIDTLNHALLRLRLDEACQTAPNREVHVWISTYGLPADETAALQARLQRLVGALYPQPSTV